MLWWGVEGELTDKTADTRVRQKIEIFPESYSFNSL